MRGVTKGQHLELVRILLDPWINEGIPENHRIDRIDFSMRLEDISADTSPELPGDPEMVIRHSKDQGFLASGGVYEQQLPTLDRRYPTVTLSRIPDHFFRRVMQYIDQDYGGYHIQNTGVAFRPGPDDASLASVGEYQLRGGVKSNGIYLPHPNLIRNMAAIRQYCDKYNIPLREGRPAERHIH